MTAVQDPEKGLLNAMSPVQEVFGPKPGSQGSASGSGSGSNFHSSTSAKLSSIESPSDAVLTFDQFREHYKEAPPIHSRAGFEGIEVLYRNNVLFSRATLFKHCVSRSIGLDYGEEKIVKEVRGALNDYTQAVEDFRTFRQSSKVMFRNNETLMQVGDYMSYLERKKTDLTLPSNTTNVNAELHALQLSQLRHAEGTFFQFWASDILTSYKAGVSLEMEQSALEGLYSRLTMALVGGFILVVPMLIMVLNPSQIKSLIVTSVCTFVVAVAMAVFMRDAEPKDIIAMVAGYAAVLVVFVGVNG